MFGFAGARRGAADTIKGVFATLDVGSSTVTCLLCYSDGRGDIRVLGMGARRSEGMKNGNVVDARAAQQSILNAINQAEEVAGETTERVVLSCNAGRPHSRLLELELEVDGGIANQAHIDSLTHYAQKPMESEQTDAPDRLRRLHTLAIDYCIDGREGVRDPRGMSAKHLKAKFLAVSASDSALQTLIDCVERCHLQVTDVIAGPLAAAYGALNPEELDQGTTLIDFGADCTTISAFHAGKPVHLEVLPTGSDVLTTDLSAALGCRFSDAERVKCLHGAAFLRPTDGMVDVSVPSIDPFEAPTRVNRAFLVDVLQARLDELFDKVAKRLDHPKLLPFSSKRIVLTGGGAGLVGLKDYVAVRLRRATRLGRPLPMAGLSHVRLSTNHSSAVGIANYLIVSQNEKSSTFRAVPSHRPGIQNSARMKNFWSGFTRLFAAD